MSVTFFLLVFGGCDSSFEPDLGPHGVVPEHAQVIREWYVAELAREQESGVLYPGVSGKTSGDSLLTDSLRALVLAEMVRQYPPDWSQLKQWARDGGGYYGAVPLGVGNPSVPKVSVVRTLVVDLSADLQVMGGRIVEFWSLDGLDPSLYADYARLWVAGDYGEKRLLVVAEYTVGYAGKRADLYDPSDGVLNQTSLSLQRSGGVGKTEVSLFCWVSKIVRDGWVCAGDGTGCVLSTPGWIEVTCISYDEDGGGGDGGGGEEEEECPQGEYCGVGLGGDDDDDDDDDDGFSLDCRPERVTRGGSVTCKLSPDSSGVKVNWSSSVAPDASHSGTGEGAYQWTGRATNTTIITVTAGSWNSDKKIIVKARGNDFKQLPELNADPEYAHLASPTLGDYSLLSGSDFQYKDGTGPWAGRVMVASSATFSSRLRVSSDYSSPWPSSWPMAFYSGANKTCLASETQLKDKETMDRVNRICGTIGAMEAFVDEIIAHEREHEDGYNKCLRGSNVLGKMSVIEGLTGSYGDVSSQARRLWEEIKKLLRGSGAWAAPRTSGKHWYYRGGWLLDKRSAGYGHGWGSGCDD